MHEIHRITRYLAPLLFLLVLNRGLTAQQNQIIVKPAQLTPAKEQAFQWINSHSSELAEWNDQIWRFAELALREIVSYRLPVCPPRTGHM